MDMLPKMNLPGGFRPQKSTSHWGISSRIMVEHEKNKPLKPQDMVMYSGIVRSSYV